ncbi:MAG: hypothetical protein ABFC94_18910 [Syntrophomonas sp.]
MAVTASPSGSALLIYVDNDTGTGTTALKYQNVKVDADVYDVANGANGLAKLQARNFMTVFRTNTVELENA